MGFVACENFLRWHGVRANEPYACVLCGYACLRACCVCVYFTIAVFDNNDDVDDVDNIFLSLFLHVFFYSLNRKMCESNAFFRCSGSCMSDSLA